uniref:BTB domain-containing protein n=1 Tax=Angiostrongylus cantonensis TaxID=6313 RepID=A0A0K0D4I8_ANGCA
MLHLDHLKAVQRNFTPCGLNIVIEWMYGTRIEFSIDKLTEALAAAFALEIYDMVDATEQAVLTCSKDPFTMTVLLHHIEYFTPETKRKLLMESAASIEQISTMTPFLALPSPIFKRIIKKAINSLKKSQRGPFSVIKSIVFWEAENFSNKVAVSLLKQTPFDDLSNVEINRLYEMAREFGLENMAQLILCQCRTLSTS